MSQALLERALRTLSAQADELAALRADAREPLVITGVGARLPGLDHGEGLLSWALDGAVHRAPNPRWDPAEAPEVPLEVGLCAPPLLAWDPSPHGLDRAVAARLDPLQRWLLDLSEEALEDARLAPRAAGRAGVVIGCAGSDWVSRQSRPVDALYGQGGAASQLATRLASRWGFRGPAFTLDAACASFLVALLWAAGELRRRAVDTMLVGSAALLLDPRPSRSMALSGLLGQGRPLTRGGDGFWRGEGALVLVLRRASDHRGPAWARLLGGGISQGGAEGPSPRPQVEALEAALREAGGDRRRVGFLEGHFSGTAAGDQLELTALEEVFRGVDGQIALGAVKGRVGHLEGACGAASLAVALGVLRSGRLPPLLGVDLDLPPGFRAPGPGEALVGDRAVVQALGFGGTAAAVVLEAVPPAEVDPGPSWPAAWSASSPAALVALAAGPDPGVAWSAARENRPWRLDDSGRPWRPPGVRLELSPAWTPADLTRLPALGLGPAVADREGLLQRLGERGLRAQPGGVPLEVPVWADQAELGAWLARAHRLGADVRWEAWFPEGVPARGPAHPRQPSPLQVEAERSDPVAALCAAASEILERPVGPDDELGAAGLDSMRAVRLAARLSEAGIELSLPRLLAGGTPREVLARPPARSVAPDPTGGVGPWAVAALLLGAVAGLLVGAFLGAVWG